MGAAMREGPALAKGARSAILPAGPRPEWPPAGEEGESAPTFGARTMSAVVVIRRPGADEGKGRTVDLLAQEAPIVARYSAGDNAGHTIINHLGKFVLHLVPAGIFYPDKICLIGN